MAKVRSLQFNYRFIRKKMRREFSILKNVISLIAVFSYSQYISAQLPPDTVSMRKIISSTADDSSKMIAHLNLGKFLIDVNNDSSMAHAQKAYLLSLQVKSKNYEAQSLDFMGAVALRRGNTDQALEFLLEALKLFESFNDSTFLIVTNRNLGGVYKSQNDTTKAREYYSNALKIRPRIDNDSLFYSWVLMDLGDLFLRMNKPDSALYYTNQSLDLTAKLSIKYRKKYLPIALNTIGRIYETTGKYNEALAKYKQAVNVAFENYNLQAAGDNYMAIAFLFRRGLNIDSGLYYAKQAFIIARQVNNPQAIELSSGYLKDYFKDKNFLDSAFIYQEIMSTAKDSLLSLEKIRQIQNLSFNEQMQRQETQREREQLQNKIKMYSLLFGLVFFLAMAFILWRNNMQKQKAKVKIEQAYEVLKSAQAQLIQSEKMASLGELTAGIAHEIQNPLNFVNNFSEVNTELIEELKAERLRPKAERDDKLQDEILNDINENEQKINHHGKRADAIVKGMLQHSRSSSGVKEPTDINALADEYLRLAYHGLRAKDKEFNATMKTDYDEAIGNINIVPQDIGRVILNLITNAFYAVTEKKKTLQSAAGGEVEYEPTVTVSTKLIVPPPTGGGQRGADIRVKDNGNGIPQKVLDKIFQPFFTTKPTGQGTGLGLSLSYDIIKAHGGQINVDTKEGEGSEFIITLPV
jgi:two-component system NtrC family sensor kinase